MTPENATLIRDTKALIRESKHVKRAAGWADITEQLSTALERSEEIRESLEVKVQELAVQLDRALYDVAHPAYPKNPPLAHEPMPLPVLDDDDLADALERPFIADPEDEDNASS